MSKQCDGDTLTARRALHRRSRKLWPLLGPTLERRTRLVRSHRRLLNNNIKITRKEQLRNNRNPRHSYCTLDETRELVAAVLGRGLPHDCRIMTELPTGDWSFSDTLVSACEEGLRIAVRQLFCDRLADGNKTLVSQLLGLAHGAPHCYRRGRAIEQTTLDAYRLAAGTLGGEVVVAAVYRSSEDPPSSRPRRRLSEPFTEILLLCTRPVCEHRGFASGLVEHLSEWSIRHGLGHLVVRWRDTRRERIGRPML